MFGAIILAVIIVFVLPSAVLISGGIASAVLGHFLVEDAEHRHAGSELVELE